jgi:hypothetical protein
MKTVIVLRVHENGNSTSESMKAVIVLRAYEKGNGIRVYEKGNGTTGV